jgi:hypothetical protein
MYIQDISKLKKLIRFALCFRLGDIDIDIEGHCVPRLIIIKITLISQLGTGKVPSAQSHRAAEWPIVGVILMRVVRLYLY